MAVKRLLAPSSDDGNCPATSDQSPCASVSTPDAPPSTSAKAWKGSADASLRRKDFHPVNGIQIRNCCCPSSRECRAIMWRYADLNDKEACQYLFLPGHLKKEGTPTGRHVIQFRDNVFNHLFGYGANDVKEDLKIKECYVAYHHFPPLFCHLL